MPSPYPAQTPDFTWRKTEEVASSRPTCLTLPQSPHQGTFCYGPLLLVSVKARVRPCFYLTGDCAHVETPCGGSLAALRDQCNSLLHHFCNLGCIFYLLAVGVV